MMQVGDTVLKAIEEKLQLENYVETMRTLRRPQHSQQIRQHSSHYWR